ncbi:hypothetical protein HDZ31DRAFT_84452 [Schizophyllum fasciatum]
MTSSTPIDRVYLDTKELTAFGRDDAHTPLLPGVQDLRLAEQQRRRTRVRRLCHLAFLTTLLVFAVHLLADTVRYQTARVLGLDSDPEAMAMNDHEYPIPEGVALVDCPAWEISEDARVGRASFQFALPAHELFALARGPRSHGAIWVRQSDDATDDVRVNVEMRSDSPTGFDHAKACLARRAGDEDTAGLGIFTKHWWDEPRHLHTQFAIELVLPKRAGDEVLQVHNLTTDLPIFKHTIADLADTVLFESLTLRTTDASIYTQSLHAHQASILTTNAAIDGTYLADAHLALRTANGRIAAIATAATLDAATANGAIEGAYTARRALALVTQNAHIHATFALENDDPAGPPARAKLQTTNGQIRAAGDLSVADSPAFTSTATPSFAIDAHTTNGALALDLLAAPLDSALALDAHTTMGRADVRLPPTYEGAFDARTSLARVHVQPQDGGEGGGEGGGRGRRAVRLERNTANHVRGTVGWSEEGRKRGQARVSSQMGAVSLWV